MSVQEKILLNLYRLGREKAHITVNMEICKQCELKPCLYVCPVENYKLEDGEVAFSCDACVECGACRLVCAAGAIEWSYPRGGLGVCFRYG
jgi:ferredoxin like protein